MPSDAPSPQPPPPPPPPPAPTAGDSGKAGGGMRALGVLLALVLGFAAAVMIAVAVDIGGTTTCEDFPTLTLAEQVDQDNECFDGSSAQKAVSVVFAWASGIVGALAAVLALMFAFTGRRGGLLVRAAGAAVVLGALSIGIGSI